MNTVQNDKAFREDFDLVEKTRMWADLATAMTHNLSVGEAKLMRVVRQIPICRADVMGLGQTRVQ
jgi:hypothetical protein